MGSGVGVRHIVYRAVNKPRGGNGYECAAGALAVVPIAKADLIRSDPNEMT